MKLNPRISENIRQLTKCYINITNDPITITKHSLSLAEKLNEYNAFISISEERSLQQSESSASRYKEGKNAGRVDGVPIAVKDNFCTKGIATTCASRMLSKFVPTYNATVYERLEKEGAVLIGKTNMDQFGMGSGTIDSLYGPTKNIWSSDLKKWRIAGGSSGGSACAVAAGIIYAGIGSDTGGSTRNPASYCGVVGFKPTYGLVSRFGLIPLVNSMDVPGILTRTVDDCITILNIVAGPDSRDSTTIKTPFTDIALENDIDIKNLRIGIPLEYHCDGLHSEVLETWMKVADLLEESGAQVNQVSLPNTASSIVVYSILNQCEVSSNMARYDGIEFGHRSKDESSTEQLYAKSRADGFNDVVKNRILSGNYFLLRKNYDKYFEKALRVRRLISNDFSRAFKDFDVLLTPTTLTDAPLYDDFVQSKNRDQCAVQDFCTQPANMAGIPAISIPIRLSSNNLPLSLQLMSNNLNERVLFKVAKWIENKVDFLSVYK